MPNGQNDIKVNERYTNSADRKLRILLITYYWPPAGGVAVQRWMKFADLISREKDVEIVVYTVANPDYPEVDEQQLRDVDHLTTWKRRIFEPYALFRLFTGRKRKYKVQQEFATSSNKRSIDKLAIWIRGNFFIPDARKFWIAPSVRFLRKKWKEGSFDCVVTNGTPHSVHLIALELKRYFKFRWIADFRDPWTKVDYFEDLHLSKRARQRHIDLEKKVLDTADHVVTVSPAWAKDFEELGARNVSVVTNGYDPADFAPIPTQLDRKFSIAHVGNLNNRRNKLVFWKVLKRLCNEIDGFEKDLVVKLVGGVDPGVRAVVDQFDLNDQVEFVGPVNHSDAIRYMKNARLLLLLVGDDSLSEGRIPAKVFEYMAAHRPVLAITPNKSDVKTVIQNAGAGTCIDDKNTEEELYTTVRKEFERFKNDEPFSADVHTEQFTRSSLANKMLQIIKG